jgi:bacterioferritin-associated ferredoxin
MWVCICHGIRCRDVKDAAGNGAARVGDVFRQFDVRVRCGKCVPTICNLLKDEGQAANESTPPAAPLTACCADG